MSVKKVVIDPHVHFYNCFSPDLFFENTLKNLEFLIRPFYSQGPNIVKAIFLTEGEGYDYYSLFGENAKIARAGRYTFEKREGGRGLALRDKESVLLYILPGKQVVTSERLEVLSLGSSLDVSDGMSIYPLLDSLIERKIVTVLPWGLGKWLGKRKNLMMDIISRYRSPYLLLSDSTGRPLFWGLPAPLKYGLNAGFKIINGSDPFPIRIDNKRAGTAGFMIEGDWDEQFPVRSIRALLLSEGPHKVTRLGKRDGVTRFLIRQALLKKRSYVMRSK